MQRENKQSLQETFNDVMGDNDLPLQCVVLFDEPETLTLTALFFVIVADDKKDERVWYIYAMEFYSAIKKEWNVSFSETWMDLEDCHKERSKSEREKQILDNITYMWNLEQMIEMNLFPKQK